MQQLQTQDMFVTENYSQPLKTAADDYWGFRTGQAQRRLVPAGVSPQEARWFVEALLRKKELLQVQVLKQD